MCWPPVIHGVLTKSAQLFPTQPPVLGLFFSVPAQPPVICAQLSSPVAWNRTTAWEGGSLGARPSSAASLCDPRQVPSPLWAPWFPFLWWRHWPIGWRARWHFLLLGRMVIFGDHDFTSRVYDPLSRSKIQWLSELLKKVGRHSVQEKWNWPALLSISASLPA